MSLVTFHAQHGLKLYDVRSVINTSMYKPDFNRLTVDPYVKEGYRRKHLVRYKYHGSDSGIKTYSELPHAPLFQSSSINPTHGGLQRHYPKLTSYDPRLVKNMLDLFVSAAKVPEQESILLQYQRVTTSTFIKGQPSVEGYHRDGVERIGIICMDRENIIGGVNEFRLNTDHSNVVRMELSRGYMVIIDDNIVQHRVTEIEPVHEYVEAYRDVILIAYPG